GRQSAPGVRSKTESKWRSSKRMPHGRRTRTALRVSKYLTAYLTAYPGQSVTARTLCGTNRQTAMYARHVLACLTGPGKIGQSPLNPRFRSTPCASTDMLCLRRPASYMSWATWRAASYLRRLTASPGHGVTCGEMFDIPRYS